MISAKTLGFIACLICSLRLDGEQPLDYEVRPLPADNFLEARFRFVNPDPNVVPERILVYLPGTDGDARYLVNNEKFLEACRRCRAAFVGCYFRGEGLPYDLPSGGSGRALDEALNYFAVQTKLPGLSSRPLLMMGFSQGSQFTFNYLCWRPERLQAFAAIKAGGFQLTPQKSSYQVPGVIVAGEHDGVGRIRTSAKAFSDAAGKQSRWAFLFEKNSGHDVTRTGDFVLPFFEAVCGNGPSAAVYRHADSKQAETSPSSAEDLCWFPDNMTAEAWAQMHRAISLTELATAPDPPNLASLVTVSVEPSSFKCENNETKSGIVKIDSKNDHISIDQISISGDGFLLRQSGAGKPPLVASFSFSPKNQEWGCSKGDLVISGKRDDQDLGPIDIGLQAMVQGGAETFPKLIYFGVVAPYGNVTKTVLIHSDKAGSHISSVKCSQEVSANLHPKNKTDDYEMNVVWAPSNRLGQMTGTIEITFDQPEKGTLRLPVVGVVSR